MLISGQPAWPRMPRVRLARPWLALLVFAVLAASGCASPATDEAPAEESGGLTVDANRPDTSFGDVQTGPAVGPDLNATTEAPPRLVEGEWWRIRYNSGFYGEGDVEFVRVVANATSEGYIFGMPHEGWFKEAIAFHAPAFGDVGLDLSYNTHNMKFEPVRFPLRQGDTWTTTFAAAEFQATVDEADAVTAKISLVPTAEPGPEAQLLTLIGQGGGDQTIRLTYDARMHEVVRMESTIGTWEVVAHGYEFRGWVTVPRGEHTAIDYGTFGPATPGEPVLARDVAVEGGFNRMTLMHLVFAIGPGAYRITSTPPGGEEPMVTEHVGPAGFKLAFYEAMNPDGTWAQEDVVAGAGGTYSMGIAYHQYDIQVPGGARRTDHAHAVIR